MDARAYKVKTTRRDFARALEGFRAQLEGGVEMPAGAEALYSAASRWFALMAKRGQREELGETRRSGHDHSMHACIRTIVGPKLCGCPICEEPWKHDPRFNVGSTPPFLVELHHASGREALTLVELCRDVDTLRLARRAETVGQLHRPRVVAAIDRRLEELEGASFDRLANVTDALRVASSGDAGETDEPGLFDGPMAELAPAPDPVADAVTVPTWRDGEDPRRARRVLELPGAPTVDEAAGWRTIFYSHPEAEWAGFCIEAATGARVLARVLYSRDRNVWTLVVNGQPRRMQLGSSTRAEAVYSNPAMLAEAVARCGLEPWRGARPRLCVIGCSATKAETPGRARDVYKATALQGLAYAELAGLVPVFASALHHVVEVDQHLEPYDQGPPRGNVGRGTWGAGFLERLERLGYLRDGVELEWHAGESYARGAELATLRAITGPELSAAEKQLAKLPDAAVATRLTTVASTQPLMGMAIGRRRQWYSQRLELLRERAA